MLRFLGILSLGHLFFGGRHHHLRRGILFGALLGWLANRDFDTDRAAEDVRRAARTVRRTAHDAVRAARREIRNAAHDRRTAEIHERIDRKKAEHEEHLRAVRAEIEARKAEREERLRAVRAGADARKARREEDRKAQAERKGCGTVVQALPECDTKEAREIRELTEELERDARTAAMYADVPVLHFPENEKYFSARKYEYGY